MDYKARRIAVLIEDLEQLACELRYRFHLRHLRRLPGVKTGATVGWIV